MLSSSSSPFSAAPPLIIECKDTSERIDLCEAHGLYIKPIARLNITIQLPPTKLPGQSVSVSEIVEKLRRQIAPDEFLYLRVIKSTLEFIRCEAEIENKSSFKTLLAKLDGCSIRMSATYTDVLKVRAAEAKISYPMRHDWETFFKDAYDPSVCSELKPGERPDTIHLVDLPCKWFSGRSLDVSESNKPSEQVVRDVFAVFGELRMLDICVVTPSSSSASAPSLQGSAIAGAANSVFEAFVQYKDYISFVKAMDTFRGMKLLFIDNADAFTANIRVDFDRTHHLSDKEIKRREVDKLKAIEMEKIKTAQAVKEKDKESKQKEIDTFRIRLLDDSMDVSGGGGGGGDERADKTTGSDEKSKEQRRREREEARRQKRLAQKQHEEEKKLELKIAMEERKILIAQRKLESMRLLEELFNRVKVIVGQEETAKRDKEAREARLRHQREEENKEQLKRMRMEQQELELKEKIERNLAAATAAAVAIAAKLSSDAPGARKAANEEEFELRKSPKHQSSSTAASSTSLTPHYQQEMRMATSPSGSGGGGEAGSPNPSSHVMSMPRALLLSSSSSSQHQSSLAQQKQQQAQQKAQLYDEDEGHGMTAMTAETSSNDGQAVVKNDCPNDDDGEIGDEEANPSESKMEQQEEVVEAEDSKPAANGGGEDDYDDGEVRSNGEADELSSGEISAETSHEQAND